MQRTSAPPDIVCDARSFGVIASIRRSASKFWSEALIIIIAVSLWLPRLSGPIDLRYDASVYYLLGTSLAAGKGYRIESEPGSLQALQYPPLLPAIIAAYQKALGTSDPAIVARWLRLSYALLFVIYALAALALAKQFLSPGLAVVTVALCLFHHQSIFLCDLLFAELPFALIAIAFVLVGRFRSSSDHWLAELGSFALATAGFLLRTVGLAMLVAWTFESATRWKWRRAFARAAVALIPVLAWQAYVSHVRASAEYSHPAYEYQRAAYQYYNVSYAENAFLVDPFKPELGHLTVGTFVSRLTANSTQLLEAFAEAVSTNRPQWERLLNGLQRRLFHDVITPRWFVFVPIYLLSAFVIGGFFILVRRRAWLLILLLLGSVGLLLTTPWPEQFLRYLAPLLIFLDLCFVLGLDAFVRLLAARNTRGAATVARTVFVGILIIAFGMEAFTAARLYYLRQTRDAIVFDPGSDRPYRLFAHDETWRAWEKAVNWINTHAPREAVVATTAPHSCYLLTGLKAVLPPMQADPLKASQLLAAVPVSYVIIDDLEFSIVARRYARPAVESQPSEWRLVQSEGRTKVYEHIPPRRPQ